ncbi:Vacuolar membrane-associated protein IML1, partial [Cyberlindnera fabianii]
MNTMHSNALTLTVRRDKDNALAVESNAPLTPRRPLLRHRSQVSEVSSQQAPAPIETDHFDEPVHLSAAFHDTRVASENVLIDVSQIPGANEGDVAELETMENSTRKKLLFVIHKMNDELMRRAKTTQVSILGNISAVYREGKKVFSSYIGENTKVVFRSESARLVFLIQMTEEMYHFQEDGEVMFHKFVSSLFPTIFKRWRDEGTHHLITIVFAANIDTSENSWTDLKEGQRCKNTKDFYRVVVDQVNIVHWNDIMISLRYEFANFRKDIISHQLKHSGGNTVTPRFVPTIKSDILNTINLATTLVVDRFRDPDLRHTTTHFIVVSAGNGLFDVDYDDLLDTSKRIFNSELSVDILCMAQPPLHATPLFRYRDHSGQLHHCIPGWVDVSYWTEQRFRNNQWIPRCKIYELQMMGVMENEMSTVTVQHLQPSIQAATITDMMDEYDKNVFSSDVSKAETQKPKKKESSSSLLWKVQTHTPVKAKAERTVSSPVFSNVTPLSALSSLQQIGKRPNTSQVASALSENLSPDVVKSISVGKWQDVFPRYVKRRKIKWISLETPSELPVTTPIFPTPEDFAENFTFQTHQVTVAPERENYMTPSDLLREMVYLRLSVGFQICYGPKVEKVEMNDTSLLMKKLPQTRDFTGMRVYMSLDEEIHRILCDYDGTINVQRYNRRQQQDFYRNSFNRVMVKTRYQNHYHPYYPDPAVVKPKTFKWNAFDQKLAGYDDDNDFFDKKTLNRMKFVLLPTLIPKTTYMTTGNDKQDVLSAEEIRVEGLRRLIVSLHRGIFNPDGKRQKSKKEEIFPEINFYTGDLISFLKEQEHASTKTATEQKSQDGRSSSLTGTLTRESPTDEIVAMLHGPKGVLVADRKWHWKIHRNVFRGLDLVNWLYENFSDMSSRDEATAFGNELMDRGVFVHVENRHKFLDGHFFYRLSPLQQSTDEEVDPEKEIKKTKSESSVPAVSQVITPVSSTNGERRTFVLSRSLRYDLDTSRKSYRREVMMVHYDNVHNPNHCFHIRLEWLTATPKLIEDTINSWSRMCERYGLKLVETPWAELCEIPRLNPFHSFVDIVLAINPWEDPEFNDASIINETKFYYHIYLLEYSGFLMDNRASLFFQNDNEFEILYSWGKPEFKYAQYIHKTGAYIAEIRDTGDLFLAPNNTHISR